MSPLQEKLELVQLLEKRELFSQELSSSVLQWVSWKEQKVSLSVLKEKLEQVGVRQWDESVSLWILQKKKKKKKEKLMMRKMMKENGSWIEDQCVDVDVDELEYVSGLVLGQEQEQEVCFLRW